jgi:hypothetical protein
MHGLNNIKFQKLAIVVTIIAIINILRHLRQ